MTGRVGVTAGDSEVVIATKLFRPSPRQQTVERSRLHDLLRQGLTWPLTLVVAPAGWGKSTLVAEWLRQDRVTAGWVSLDSGDDDPTRFWRYLLLAACQAGRPRARRAGPGSRGWMPLARTSCVTCSPHSSTRWRRQPRPWCSCWTTIT